jgi:acyl-CoA thioester hydrolase
MTDKKNKSESLPRTHFSAWIDISSRWSDNDQYGHINNVVYYSFFDTAVNQLLIQMNLLDPKNSDVIGLVVQSHCEFTQSLSFPCPIQAGVRVAHIGRSSVRYEIGLFAAGKMYSAANGYFVHVYVDRHSRIPVAVAPTWRERLACLMINPSENQ